MEKKKLQEYYDELNKIYNDFYVVEIQYKDGKNKKIRDNAYRRLESLLDRFEFYVGKDWDLYTLITSPNGEGLIKVRRKSLENLHR